MNYSCFFRKIDELGRIVLPIEIRQFLNIKERDALEISILDGGIYLKKNQDTCILCNSTTELLKFKDKNLCKDCINKLKMS